MAASSVPESVHPKMLSKADWKICGVPDRRLEQEIKSAQWPDQSQRNRQRLAIRCNFGASSPNTSVHESDSAERERYGTEVTKTCDWNVGQRKNGSSRCAEILRRSRQARPSSTPIRFETQRGHGSAENFSAHLLEPFFMRGQHSVARLCPLGFRNGSRSAESLPAHRIRPSWRRNTPRSPSVAVRCIGQAIGRILFPVQAGDLVTHKSSNLLLRGMLRMNRFRDRARP